MSTMIGGVKREVSSMPEFEKKVGLFEANVVAINPDGEELNELLGVKTEEEARPINYLDTAPDGTNRVRIDVWLEEVKSKQKFKMSMWLEDKIRESRDGLKKQYINEAGASCWATEQGNLADWFIKREYREAHVGEEIFYNFLRTWLGKLDYNSPRTTLVVAWNKIMRNSLSELRAQIGGEWTNSIVAMATIQTKEREGEVREYQSVYGKAVLPVSALKQFRLVDYHNADVLRRIQSAVPRDLSIAEKFVKEVTGQFGCRDYYRFKDIESYNPNNNVATSDKVISDDGADF